MLSTKAVEEFKEIYERKFSKKISYETALEMATELIELWRVIYRPIKNQNEFKNSQKENAN